MNHRTRSPNTRRRPSFGRQRRGNVALLLLGLVIVIGLIVAAIWYVMGSDTVDTSKLPLTTEVKRGQYEHYVLEQGEVESSNNVEIRCEVKNRQGGSSPSTSILDVIEEGKWVEKGDWLVTFDASAMENDIRQQRIVVNSSKTLVIQAKATYDTAVIAKEEYLKGTYEQERKTILNEIFVAKENLEKSQLSFDSIKRSVARGLVTALQLRGEQFRVDAAKNELDLAEQKLDVLDQFTKKKFITQLDSDIEAAQVRLENEQASHQEEETKLAEIEEQIAKCKVVAPDAGQVVYANVQSSRSGSEFVVEAGAAVRERQVIIRLPDPGNMQVKANVNEARVNLVRVGMPVEITISSFGETPLMGTVSKVNKYAEPGNWWSSTSKQYATIVKIQNPPPEIRSGLTAEVRIHVENEDDALLIPVQTIYEKNGHTFCLVQKSSTSWETAKVGIKSTNEKVVMLDEATTTGVGEGDTVVLNPRQHVDKFNFDKFPEVFAEPAPPEVPAAVATAAATADGPSNAGGGGARPAGGRPGGAAPEAGGTPNGGGARPGAAAGAGGGGQRRSPGESFRGFDSDGDGKLSAEEFTAVPSGFRERLSGADSDGDGSVTLSEWTAAITALRSASGGGGGRPGGAGGGGGQ